MAQAQRRDPAAILPEVTWDAIAPPYPDYPYFKDCESFPFRPWATGCDLVNAWWLIEASSLAYADEDFARPHFQRAGLPVLAFFSQGGTQCYVAGNDEGLLVVFRGTEIRRRAGSADYCHIVADLMTDLDIRLVDSGRRGRVHRGFQQALEEVWEKQGLEDFLRSHHTGNRTLWFTGHSLGAALATLAANLYGPASTLYTFGSPRVGDLEFTEDFPVAAYRFVNHHDVVTRVPPSGPYRHVGELQYIDRWGSIPPNSFTWEKNANELSGAMSSWLESVCKPRFWHPTLIPGCIIDHVPILYATHIWNNIPG